MHLAVTWTADDFPCVKPCGFSVSLLLRGQLRWEYTTMPVIFNEVMKLSCLRLKSKKLIDDIYWTPLM